MAAAIRALAEGNKVIAEGAGAISVAAALAARHPFKRVCAVVSGGNLDPDMLTTILAGARPGARKSPPGPLPGVAASR